ERRCFFFFSSRRRHTSLVSDWSSDVCSSDLHHHDSIRRAGLNRGDARNLPPAEDLAIESVLPTQQLVARADRNIQNINAHEAVEIGRASCRERVEIEGVGVTVRETR